MPNTKKKGMCVARFGTSNDGLSDRMGEQGGVEGRGREEGGIMQHNVDVINSLLMQHSTKGLGCT